MRALIGGLILAACATGACAQAARRSPAPSRKPAAAVRPGNPPPRGRLVLAPAQFASVLFYPHLQIRTREIAQQSVSLYVVPRDLFETPPKGKKAPPRPIPPGSSVTTSALNPEYRAVETRLARFILALQRGRRELAASLLSRRVPAAERRALIEARWLPRPAKPNPVGFLEIRMRKENGKWWVDMRPSRSA